MTVTFSGGEGGSGDLIAETEAIFRDTAFELAAALRDLRAGPPTDAKAAVQAVRDLRAALQMVMDERNRVEKLRKNIAGDAGSGALDLDAARDEIGRRLACLRRAGGG
ncbi:hypothetical protein [Phaeovulum vinaykumarii]|uniref:Permease n=1 Tax=Phaeovulum vinaykumarii TaxID=407234 RepID=A0A1N7JKR8_9RHOB|nr:hypothetical protein [Phaeovulum vinaykumarii]SIS49854.1 hypothetical protein SAMN05421795_101100 [Phaeovulum vinaykumarii]SOB89955.1 hypothetical protein SAMN05878426_101100 [Phaeovulum vinaykumarii]